MIVLHHEERIIIASDMTSVRHQMQSHLPAILRS